MKRLGSLPLVYLLLLFVVISGANSLGYDVHWLGGATSIERIPSQKQNVDIYCYPGTDKNLLALWQTVKFHIRMKSDEFSQYLGESPEQVYNAYTEDSYGWSVVTFQQRGAPTVSVDLFQPTCMAVNTKHRHTIELQIQRVDIWRMILMGIGITLIFSSRALSGNPVFYYLCGITVGVLTSFMLVIYYISKLFPKKTMAYGLLIGGWTVGMYMAQHVYENLRGIVATRLAYVAWYAAVAALLSFVVCYRLGPPRDQRSKNLVMWSLQGIGGFMIFFSSQYQEASSAVAITALLAKYFPRSIIDRIQRYWRCRFPPKPSLLTNEEYFEQGVRETQKNLDELRKFCSSPDCAQWRIMMRLNDAKRFARFVEGASHLSDSEVLDYQAYANWLDKPDSRAHSTRHDISDDDSDYDDEE